MEKLENGQKVANFYGVKVGGSIGERVPVLIGSIFYKGHKIVIDDKKGEFDKEAAEREINGFLEFSDKTGIPVIIDIVGGFKESLVKYCEYVGENTDLPFLLDGMNDTARLYAIEKILEQGYQDRVIYNSIEPNITEETMAKLSDLKLKNAVILCFGAGALTPKKKLSLLKGKEGKEGLLSKVERIGIENYMVDVAVLDIPSLSIAANSIRLVKEELKVPAGCAPINALAEWSNRKMFGKQGYITSTASIATYMMDAGADFIMYGSINKGDYVFPSVALISGINAYYKKRIDRVKITPPKFFEFL